MQLRPSARAARDVRTSAPLSQGTRRTPSAPVLPGHRAVAADLSIGGFSGAWVRTGWRHGPARMPRFACPNVSQAWTSKVTRGRVHGVHARRGSITRMWARKLELLKGEGVKCDDAKGELARVGALHPSLDDRPAADRPHQAGMLLLASMYGTGLLFQTNTFLAQCMPATKHTCLEPYLLHCCPSAECLCPPNVCR